MLFGARPETVVAHPESSAATLRSTAERMRLEGRPEAIVLEMSNPGAVVPHRSPSRTGLQEPGIDEDVVERVLFIPERHSQASPAGTTGKEDLDRPLNPGGADANLKTSGSPRRMTQGLPRSAQREERKRPEDQKPDRSHVQRILSPSLHEST